MNMNQHDPLAVMDEFYAAEAEYVAAGGAGEASFDRLAQCLDPDVVMYQAPGLPYSGSGAWHGHDGLQKFVTAFSETWQEMDIVEQQKLADSDTVVVLLHVRLRSRVTGRWLDTSIVQVDKIKDGRITEFRPFYWDPAAVADVCDYHPEHVTAGTDSGGHGP
ncbi:nuclear transport factor 2 family protein [Actinomycetes bacterium KLBMP 9759]